MGDRRIDKTTDVIRYAVDALCWWEASKNFGYGFGRLRPWARRRRRRAVVSSQPRLAAPREHATACGSEQLSEPRELRARVSERWATAYAWGGSSESEALLETSI